jgi:hypothetical protein
MQPTLLDLLTCASPRFHAVDIDLLGINLHSLLRPFSLSFSGPFSPSLQAAQQSREELDL